MKRSFATQRQLIATAMMMVSGLVLPEVTRAVGETPFDALSTTEQDSSTETHPLTFTEEDPFGPFIDRSNDFRFAEHPQITLRNTTSDASESIRWPRRFDVLGGICE